jgi:hypothetical protein
VRRVRTLRRALGLTQEEFAARPRLAGVKSPANGPMNVSAVAQGEGQGRGFQKIAPTCQPDRGQKTEGAEADGGDLDRTGTVTAPPPW